MRSQTKPISVEETAIAVRPVGLTGAVGDGGGIGSFTVASIVAVLLKPDGMLMMVSAPEYVPAAVNVLLVQTEKVPSPSSKTSAVSGVEVPAHWIVAV